MNINLIDPHGYCYGVKMALDITRQAANDPKTRNPIYLLGSIIHNKIVINDLIQLGIIVIHENGRSRLEMLDDVPCGTVIFSAHGVSDKVYDKAKEKGLNIVDATCPNVKLIHTNITKHLKLRHKILYIGTKNHPECEGVLELSPNITLIEKIDDLKDLNKKEYYYVTCQTTLSSIELKEIFDYIKENFENALLDNKICNATYLRQQALIEKEADMAVVVGDKNSANSQRLKYIFEKKYNKPAILVEKASDLEAHDFTGINSINLTSGASTPEEILEEVYEYLKKL